MDEVKFWTLIEEARAAALPSTDLEDLLDALQERIEDLEDPEIIAFHQQMQALYWKAFTYELAGALFIMQDRDTDEEDFRGFRGWLIAQGKDYYHRVLADPDSLADDHLIPDELYLPDILTLAAQAYRESTAESVPEDPNFVEPDEASGDPFEVTDLPKRLPKLCREFVFFLEEDIDEDAADFVEAPQEEEATETP